MVCKSVHHRWAQTNVQKLRRCLFLYPDLSFKSFNLIHGRVRHRIWESLMHPDLL